MRDATTSPSTSKLTCAGALTVPETVMVPSLSPTELGVESNASDVRIGAVSHVRTDGRVTASAISDARAAVADHPARRTTVAANAIRVNGSCYGQPIT